MALITVFEWSSFTLSVLSGVISGVVASILFYIYMRQLRPDIKLCKYIAQFQRGDQTYYAFKLYNNSRWFSVLELRIEVVIRTPFNSDGGKNYRLERIQLKNYKYMILPRYKKGDESGGYALVVTTKDDIASLWSEENQNIMFRVHGRHSFSGASKSFHKIFWQKGTSIKKGMFTFGKTDDVN